jgi:hypothetical protein
MMKAKTSLSILALMLSGCASGNVLAPYKAVVIKPHDRVALGVNITADKFRYEFHTKQKANGRGDEVKFTEIDPHGVFSTILQWSGSGAGDVPYRGINVFEFENPTNHRVVVYFDK